MSVFLLNISINPVERRLDRAIAGPRNYSDVFLSIDEAVDSGQSLLARWLGELQELLQTGNNEKSIDDIARYDVFYEFKVCEFDIDVRRIEDGKWEKYAEWEYSYKGELRDRFEWASLPDGWREGYRWRPGDEDADAGFRFKPGEFVKLKGKYKEAGYSDETIFALHHAPGSDSLGEVISTGARSDDETIYVVRYAPGKGEPE